MNWSWSLVWILWSPGTHSYNHQPHLLMFFIITATVFPLFVSVISIKIIMADHQHHSSSWCPPQLRSRAHLLLVFIIIVNIMTLNSLELSAVNTSEVKSNRRQRYDLGKRLIFLLYIWSLESWTGVSVSAAKLAALSWNPENLKKLSLNAYLQVFATKMPYLQIFATKMPYLQVFATKIALLNYMTKPSVWL